MAAGQISNATINGGGPFGFRLFGGQHAPLVVAKLRKNSKASSAGVVEGDVVLGINGYTCKGMSHATAVGLVDNSTVSLNFTLLRGTQDRNAVDAAIQELGGQLQPAPASAVPQQAVPSGPQSNGALSMQAPNPQFNGVPSNAQVSRQSHTYSQGGMTTNVQTERETRSFGGGNTVTTVKRETVSSSSYGKAPYVQSQGPKPFQPSGATPFQPSQSPNPSYNQPAQKFDAPKFKVSRFQASSTTDRYNPVGGPGGVNVQQNPDQTITMTLDIDTSEKENSAPFPRKDVPVFKVAKVADKPAGGTWQPANVLPVTSYPKKSPSPQAPAPKAKASWEQPQSEWAPKQWAEVEPEFYDPEGKDQQWPLGSAAPPPNPHLARMLQESYSSVTTEQSLSPGGHKKKVYADSAFYNDPEGKYPTIEEQIKMARKVALSLMAPQNVAARGHSMFVKRRKKADKWIAGEQQPHFVPQSEEEEEVYYSANPWDKGSHTWQPPTSEAGGIPQAPKWEPPSNVFGLSAVPSDEPDSERKKMMSADEIERQRLFSEKVSHDKLNPQLCFSLADALKNPSGNKGAMLFARRRERTEQYAHTDSEKPDRPDTAGDPKVKARILMGAQQEQLQSMPRVPPPAAAPAPPKEPEYTPGVTRLQAMIEMPKAAVSPWEAATLNQGGDCEAAFDHLKMYDAQRALLESQGRGTNPNPTQMSLEAKIQATHVLNDNRVTAGAYKATESRMPYNTSTIKPWGSGGGSDIMIESVTSSTKGSLGYGPVAPMPQTTPKVKSIIRPVQFAPRVPSSDLPMPTSFDQGYSDL